MTVDDVVAATGWAKGTARSYISKHWRPWLTRASVGTYRVDGFALISVEEFIQRQSQVKSDDYGDATELRELLEDSLRGGEGQFVEFKVAFPSQAHSFATEIAAFATSGGGTVLLGVDDAGGVVGLEAIEQPEKRADFRERVEGIARTVRPAVTPRVSFLDWGGATLCVAEVPDGDRPIYYYDHRPYVRIGSQSRPAEPEEVAALVSDWLDSQGQSQLAQLANLRTSLRAGRTVRIPVLGTIGS